MKQIKTITHRRDYAAEFDNDVNAALEDGWKLVDRFLAPVQANDLLSVVYHPIWVAFMEKDETGDDGPTIREERDLLEARLRHLMESETIRMFDEKDPRTHAYKRDISRLDNFNLPEILREYESWLNNK